VTDTGALSVSSGLKMGRVPKEKRVVLDETTKDVSKLNKIIDHMVGQREHSNPSLRLGKKQTKNN
jgi:ATP-dependent phosphoenolpyruvate carboxykinase